MNINIHLHANSSWYYYYYQMCISKRQSNIIIKLLGNTNLFIDLKQYHSEHAETKK